MAALLEDGIQVQVPAQTLTETPVPITGTKTKEQQNSSQPMAPTVQSSATLININNATQEELET